MLRNGLRPLQEPELGQGIEPVPVGIGALGGGLAVPETLELSNDGFSKRRQVIATRASPTELRAHRITQAQYPLNPLMPLRVARLIVASQGYCVCRTKVDRANGTHQLRQLAAQSDDFSTDVFAGSTVSLTACCKTTQHVIEADESTALGFKALKGPDKRRLPGNYRA